MDEWRGGRDLVILELMTNGLLSISLNISGTKLDKDGIDSFSDMFFLDPSMAQERLSRAWAFSAAWWKHHDPYQRHDLLLYGVALYNVGTRYFKRPQRSSMEGITIPPECPHDPLIVFDTPRRTSRSSIETNTTREIDRTIQMIEMRFRGWENRW